ncbi:MAG: response regulator [Lachnospiraceae bacterium]|nr:response regulator [Lachnospiraceae bacterium]
MSIETLENIIMLLAIIVALLRCLFRYIEVPRKGYLFLCISFLTHLLSDYYWTTYTLVMNDNPDISAFIAYLGWNLSYLFLLVAAYYMQNEKARRFFHPIILLPIPINVIQFLIYIQFGGYFNNAWSGIMFTAAAIICVQSLMYHVRHRNETHFPYLSLMILLYITAEYGMWTASCYSWPSELQNPYYYFELGSYAAAIFMPWAAGKEYEAQGLSKPEKNADELRFQLRIQISVSLIIFGGCAIGYYLAGWMKQALPSGADSSDVYRIIAIMLFILSIFMVLLILAIMYFITIRYKAVKDERISEPDKRRNRFNLLFTILITLGLMIFSVVYNSRLFYNVAVTRLYEDGEDKAESTANSLENYLAVAKSTLGVAADTVDMMLYSGEPQEKILQYILNQTERQAAEFDDNFTGIYGYIRGEYMDGLSWVPPEGYDVKTRDWYKAAVTSDGQTLIVPPYVDAQTHSVVVTICKLLSYSDDHEPEVVALDVITGYIQEVVETVDIGGKGYALIIDRDGTVIAHKDPQMTGVNISSIISPELYDSFMADPSSKVHSDDKTTLFISPILDQWTVMLIVSSSEFLEEVSSQLVVNILVSLVIFALITCFYYMGYCNEQAYGKKVEEMKIGRQKQEYEAEVLKLEKLAADEANRAKSGFLADMSHEIRTPINAILGMNEMILRKAGDPEVLSYSRNIKSSGRNLLHLINSILDFSKIEDGKMEIVPVRYSISTLITYLVNSVNERVREKKLDFIVNVDPKLPSELYGDDSRIDQVILNLLTNAVKYTHEGSVTLTVEGKEKKDDMILLSVEVKDTGIGIRESDMERLFESFERLDVIRNRNIEGTGLGLSIVTKLLYLMGSALRVSSEYGKGSVFSFDLWQKIESSEPIGEYSVSASVEEPSDSYRESFHAENARVLIVDDTKMNIMVAENLLKDTGLTIDTAMSGKDAIELCEKNAYDVILLDQRMPGMDGTETLTTIRARGGLNADTPAICLTADAIRGAKERYMAEGFTDYLAKPVEGRELEKMMLRYLPADKVEVTSVKESASDISPDENTAAAIAALKEAGFDTDSALSFCQNDPAIYRSILCEFVAESAEKKNRIEAFRAQKSWDDYSVLVHSLKSSSKTIGANRLSELALALEKASKEGNISVIEKNHDKTMKIYEDACALIGSIIDVSADDASDDEILEFAPSGED